MLRSCFAGYCTREREREREFRRRRCGAARQSLTVCRVLNASRAGGVGRSGGHCLRVCVCVCSVHTDRNPHRERERGSRGVEAEGERRKEKGDEARLYGHAHAQASPAVGPVACAAAGNCGGGDRGFTPRRGWRGVDQYVKIESDATHPAPLAPFEPQPLPGPAEGIAAQSTDLSPTHHFLRLLRR